MGRELVGGIDFGPLGTRGAAFRLGLTFCGTFDAIEFVVCDDSGVGEESVLYPLDNDTMPGAKATARRYQREEVRFVGMLGHHGGPGTSGQRSRAS